MKEDNLGKIEIIEEVTDLGLRHVGPMEGSNGSRIGIMGALNILTGSGEYDGYHIKTNKNEFYILISSYQCCCEDWGYFSTNDNVNDYIGKEIKDITLTDTNLTNKKFEQIEYLDEGGVQFVTFHMTDGDVLQFAVYNCQNGYYGHDIIIAKNDDVLLNDVL